MSSVLTRHFQNQIFAHTFTTSFAQVDNITLSRLQKKPLRGLHFVHCRKNERPSTYALTLCFYGLAVRVCKKVKNTNQLIWNQQQLLKRTKPSSPFPLIHTDNSTAHPSMIPRAPYTTWSNSSFGLFIHSEHFGQPRNSPHSHKHRRTEHRNLGLRIT